MIHKVFSDGSWLRKLTRCSQVGLLPADNHQVCGEDTVYFTPANISYVANPIRCSLFFSTSVPLLTNVDSTKCTRTKLTPDGSNPMLLRRSGPKIYSFLFDTSLRLSPSMSISNLSESGCALTSTLTRFTSATPSPILITSQDTVNSVGLIPRRLPFTTSNTIVRTFRHAVSLDERRAKFKPNLWNRPNEKEQTLSISDQKAHPKPAHHAKKMSQHQLEQKYARDRSQPTDIDEVTFRRLHLPLSHLSDHRCGLRDVIATSVVDRSTTKLCIISRASRCAG